MVSAFEIFIRSNEKERSVLLWHLSPSPSHSRIHAQAFAHFFFAPILAPRTTRFSAHSYSHSQPPIYSFTRSADRCSRSACEHSCSRSVKFWSVALAANVLKNSHKAHVIKYKLVAIFYWFFAGNQKRNPRCLSQGRRVECTR